MLFERIKSEVRVAEPSFGEIDPGVIIQERVRAVTIDHLLREYGIEHLDLLQVDTEGYDAEVVKMVIESNHRPKLISFEVLYLTREDYIDLHDLLLKNGYYVCTDGFDAIAFSSSDGGFLGPVPPVFSASD